MMARLRKTLRRYRRDEDGAITIEFVVLTPLLFTIFMTAMELGIYSMRQMWLDRGLDIAVRAVRLNTGNIPTHDAFKGTICSNAPFLPDCNQNLKLEMILVDPRAFTTLPDGADCTDQSLPISSNEELRNFEAGGNHDLMLVRACLKFDPIFPSTGLGFAMFKDGSGQAGMFAFSAFVQEPAIVTASGG